MKTLRYLFSAFMLIAGFTACSNDIEDDSPNYIDVDIQECIEGEIIEISNNYYRVRLLDEPKSLPVGGQIYIDVFFQLTIYLQNIQKAMLFRL